MRRVTRLVNQKLPEVTRDNVEESRRALVRGLLAFERHRATIENTLLTARQLTPAASQARSLREVLWACGKVELRSEPWVRECLKRLADMARLDAEDASDDSLERQVAENRATFYESLCASDGFGGTSLEHPLLRRLAKVVARKREAAARRPPNGGRS
jgi:hypothetical protein